jgi:hypothetical protein
MPEYDLINVREAGSFSIIRFAQGIDDFSHRTSDLHEQLLRFVSHLSCLTCWRRSIFPAAFWGSWCSCTTTSAKCTSPTRRTMLSKCLM